MKTKHAVLNRRTRQVVVLDDAQVPELHGVWQSWAPVHRTQRVAGTVTTSFTGRDAGQGAFRTAILPPMRGWPSRYAMQEWRTHTWEEAEAAHRRACDLVGYRLGDMPTFSRMLAAIGAGVIYLGWSTFFGA